MAPKSVTKRVLRWELGNIGRWKAAENDWRKWREDRIRRINGVAISGWAGVVVRNL